MWRTTNSIKLFALLLYLILGDPRLVKAQAGELLAEFNLSPELILHNGKILTADDDFSIVEAVAIKDSKFVALGNSEEIRRLAGPNTEQIDLQGKTIVPSFFDTHLHLHDIARRWLPKEERLSFQWENLEQGLKAVKSLVDQAQPGEWVKISVPFGPSAGQENLEPGDSVDTVSRQQLDTVSANNPIVLILGISDGCVANSIAFNLARVSPDIPGVLKDPKTGEPTGQLRGVAMGLVTDEAVPWTHLDKLIPGLEREMEAKVKVGLTTVVTRMPGNDISAIRAMWDKGDLKMRWRIHHEFASRNPKAEAYLRRLGNIQGFGTLDGMIRVVSLFVPPVDGRDGDATAWTWGPQLRQMGPTPYGWSFWDATEKSAGDRLLVILAGRYGWDVKGVHSVGDRATSEVLKVYDQAYKEKEISGYASPTLDLRYGIDHVPMVTSDHIPLLKKLGVIPSLRMTEIFRSRGDPPVIGADWLSHLYGADAVQKMGMVKSLIAAGIKPVFEAEGVQPYNPLWNIEKAITRTDDKGRVWGASERINRKEGLWMYTNWASYYTGDEKILGTITPGKYADLLVLGRDYMTVPEDEIADIQVLATMVAGRFVYQAVGLFPRR